VDVPWPLVGRRSELAMLDDALLAGARPGCVVLAGAAGVGKTRLAREALARARAAGMATEWVAATRSAASIPFGAVSHLLPAAPAGGDGPALDRVAAAFEDLGAMLLAAEAATAAAAAHRAAGRRPRANASLERAAALAAACEGASSPALDPGGLVSALTPREREVAVLAAARASSRDIADRLDLSVRTVDNHLGRAYAKLGVSSRAELAALLTPRQAAPAPPAEAGRPGEGR
jgi:DNA-binding CsgD family transcriptional regulator